jgi:Mrp family chromosome partitioning ATPase
VAGVLVASACALCEPMTGYGHMDFPRFLSTVWAQRWLIVTMVVVATILALVGSLARPSRYTASADLLFGQTTDTEAIVTAGGGDTTAASDPDSATTVALASLDSLAGRVKRRFRGSATVDEIRNAVTIKPQGTSDVVTVTAEWSSPDGAAAVANAFASEIVAQRRDAERREIQQALDALSARAPRSPKISDLEYLEASADGNVRLVERASPPGHRSSPAPIRNAVAAGLAAALLGLFLGALLMRFDDRIRDEDELTELMETSVLARVPEAEGSSRGFVESFDFLRLNFQLIGREGDSHVVAVTSPTSSAGKTTVVSRLARALALSGDEVLAVDLDRRRPDLHLYLDADREPGSEMPRLLASHRHAELRAALIARGRLRQLLEELAREADWVLVDTAPVSTVADATAVVAAADGVILVVDLEESRRRDLVAAKRQLANARATLLGIVLNRAAIDLPAHRAAEEPRRLDGAGSRDEDATMRGARSTLRLR